MDADVPCESNFKGLGMVCRKCDGLIFLWMARSVVGSFLAKIPEVFAFLPAIKETVSHDFCMVEFEIDYSKIVNLFKFFNLLSMS